MVAQKLISTRREQRKVFILAFSFYNSRMSGPSQATDNSTQPDSSIRRNHQLVPIGQVGDLVEGDELKAECTIGAPDVNHPQYNPTLPDNENPRIKSCGVVPHTYQGLVGDDKYSLVCTACAFNYTYHGPFLLHTLKKHNPKEEKDEEDTVDAETS